MLPVVLELGEALVVEEAFDAGRVLVSVMSPAHPGTIGLHLYPFRHTLQ